MSTPLSHAEALCEQGILLERQGRPAEAEDACRRALAAAPGLAKAHYQLGVLLRGRECWAEAEAALRQALTLAPGAAAAWCQLALPLERQGRADEAVAALRRAMELSPGQPAIPFQLGLLMYRLGRVGEAAGCFLRVTELKPDHAEAWSALGGALNDLRRRDAAEEALRRAIALAPDLPEAHLNLGLVLRTLERFDEAVAACRQAVALRPDYAAAWTNMGRALHQMDRLEEAEEACRRAIAADPGFLAAYTHLGVILKDRDRLPEAMQAFRHVLAVDPTAAQAAYNLSIAHLMRGEFAEGWALYGWRLNGGGQWEPRPFPQPMWQGEPLAGRRLLVWGEQGIGDEMLYLGQVPELAAQGASCIVECESRLVPLLARSLPGIEVVARSDPPDPLCGSADLQCPAGNLAMVLRPTREAFRPIAPYLRPDEEVVADLRRRYGGGGDLLVGIAWFSGSSETGPKKSLPLAQWQPILRTPGVRFVSLQYGDWSAEVADIRRTTGVDIVIDDTIDGLADMDRAVAQVAAMDLVVTIDNATAATATALGKPVWGLLCRVPFWLMGVDGDRTPWHPGMLLFRQSAAGEWGDVVSAVAGRLRTEAAAAHSRAGIGCYRAGRVAEAAAAFRRSLAAAPGQAGEWGNLGLCLKALGRLEEGSEACRHALSLDPGSSEAAYNLGLIVRQQGKPDEAVAAFEQAVRITPAYGAAWSNLGATLSEMGRADGAAAAFRQAVACAPGNLDARLNLALALDVLGRFDEAAAVCRQALSADPGAARAHAALGTCLRDAGRLDEAADSFGRALALDPAAVDAHSGLAALLLARGAFEQGWAEYEWRWMSQRMARGRFTQPRWRGESLAGRQLLVWGEQGLGDELVHFGLVPEMVALGATCILECEPRLEPLLRRSFTGPELAGVEVVARTDPPDPRCLAAEVQVPVVDAAALLRPRREGFAPIPPYLKADGTTVAELRRRYRPEGREPLVGISWWSRHATQGPKMSVPLSEWLPVLRTPGVRFVSLQYGEHGQEIAEAGRAAGIGITVDPTVDPLADIDRAAAQAAAMDLVITIDNATAATAAGLGLPVWTLVTVAPYWLAGVAGEESLWHPTMRLFRQTAAGQWADVMSSVAEALAGTLQP